MIKFSWIWEKLNSGLTKDGVFFGFKKIFSPTFTLKKKKAPIVGGPELVW